MQGLIAGCLIQGVKVRDLRFNGSVLDVLHPLPVISGVTLAVGYTVLGGGWLRLKSNLLLQEFARRSLRVSAPVFAVLFGIACLYAAQIQPGVRSQWALHPIALSCLLGLFAIAAGSLAVLAERVRAAILLILGLFLFVVGISGLAWIVFPNIVPFSVSLWDAASSSTSQEFVLMGAIIVTPVVLGYSAFAYWIFRGRTPEKGWEG
jgi:cytochrome d ubiquinol oxidase subunit II